MVRVSRAAALVAASLVGCGGGGVSADGFGPDPDFASLDARLSTPTGTLSVTAVDAAVSALDVVQSSALSVDALARVTPSHTTCEALGHRDATGTCACPGGGSFAYDFSELTGGAHASGIATLRMKLSRCTIGDRVLDGEQFALRDGDTSSALTAQVTVTRANVAVDVVVWRDGRAGDKAAWARAIASDGAIVVGGLPAATRDPADRSVLVKDRRTTWTCSVNDAGLRCSSTSGTSSQERDGKP